MAEQHIALAINGRERLLRNRLVALHGPGADDAQRMADAARTRVGSVAIVGLGYVGLPTALALFDRCPRVIGVDTSEDRLAAIRSGDVDLSTADQATLAAALADGTFRVTGDSAAIGKADAVIICVPTPVDDEHTPELSALRAACATVVAEARAGQAIVLTSTTFVGSTKSLLVEPLRERGLVAGQDINVAFSAERIDPGNVDHVQRDTPRVVGGATEACSRRAGAVIGSLADAVFLVSSPEAAELTKLYENIFRAVTLALANEFADVCGVFGLDPIEVTMAAGTKPYGFLGAFPGPGVGGHCIPCDPHYLLWQLGEQHRSAPLIEQAMRSIAGRPEQVVARAVEVLADGGHEPAGARVLVVGVSYKAGVRDLRESSALPVLDGLARLGVDVHYHDALLPEITTRAGRALASVPEPRGADWDLVVVHTVHPGVDHGWVRECPLVLDATYQFELAPQRVVV